MCAMMRLILSLSECAAFYMRVLIAAARPQKSVVDGFCACFNWPNTVRAKAPER
jgi:hypothetical protein